ncbi:MAG TPA: hypothetical protein VGE67_10590 [Haloferula sp.]
MRPISWMLPALLLWLAGCTRPEHRQARDFRDKLADEIAKAAFVEVVEHSDMMDFPEEAFPDPTLRSFGDVPKIEYVRVRISAEQKRALVKRVRSFDKTASPVITFCSFVPHHTVELHSESGVASRLEICFACSDFEWDAADLQGSPESWMQEFMGFISEIGMHPKADWRDLVLKSGKVPIRR